MKASNTKMQDKERKAWAVRQLERIIAFCLYAIVFTLPFSKSLTEIFATIVIIAWIVKKGLKIKDYGLRGVGYGVWKEVFPRTPLNKPIVILFAISLISMMFSVNLILSLEGLFLKLGEYLLLYCIFFEHFSGNNGSRRLKMLINVFVISAFLIFMDAFFQWGTGRDFIRGFRYGGRLSASFSNPNSFAAWIILILPFLFCLSFFDTASKKKLFGFLLKIAGAVLFVTGLVLLGGTLARSALFAFVVSMICLGAMGIFFVRKGANSGISHKKAKIFLFLATCSIIIPLTAGMIFVKPLVKRFNFLEKGLGSGGKRIYLWQESLSVIEDFPVFGAGPNTYAYAAPNYKLTETTGCYPHNSYLQMAAETGLLGLGAFLWVLWSFFSLALKKVKKTGDLLLLGIASGLVAFLTQSFFDTSLYALQLIVLFWIMLGVGAARIARPDSDNQ